MGGIFSLGTLYWVLFLLWVPCCIGLIVIVLLQKGKGMGFAGAFGLGGGSDAVFGPRASRTLPQRLTSIMAGLFILLAMSMAVIGGKAWKGAAPEKVSEELYSGLNDLGIQPATPPAGVETEESPAPGITIDVSEPTGASQPAETPVNTEAGATAEEAAAAAADTEAEAVAAEPSGPATNTETAPAEQPAAEVPAQQ